MNGDNLYEEDRITMILKNRTGEQYTLTPTGYAPDGQSLTVDLPADIKPSHYAIQMVRKGQPVSAFSRLIVSRERSQPAIVSFNYSSVNQNPDVPMVMEREKRQSVTFIIAQSIGLVRLKFIPVSAN